MRTGIYINPGMAGEIAAILINDARAFGCAGCSHPRPRTATRREAGVRITRSPNRGVGITCFSTEPRIVGNGPRRAGCAVAEACGQVRRAMRIAGAEGRITRAPIGIEIPQRGRHRGIRSNIMRARGVYRR